MKDDHLKSYREKRDFAATPEPAPTARPPEDGAPSKGVEIFVVQKHAARSLHYDLRLEVDGVLRSWAVPKGPSMDPRQKRLAVQTEDHPLQYAGFEGTIPEGQYGAGTVMVWDTGSYQNTTEKDGRMIPMAEALNSGHASFRLQGKKLEGGFALTRTSRGWILVKMRDDSADSSRDILQAEARSVLSNKTIEELAGARK